jgi:hypothetical protein
LSQVHKDENGNYAPENQDQRMQLYMRCEGTMELFPGRPLRGKEQCCLHVTAQDAHGYRICPDNATAVGWKNGVKAELKHCGNQPKADVKPTPVPEPYYTYLIVHCKDPEMGGATSDVQILARSSVSCQDAHDKALAAANSTNKCKQPNPGGARYPNLEEAGRDFKQSGTCPP